MLLLWQLWAHQKRSPQEKDQLSVLKTEGNSREGGNKKEQKRKKEREKEREKELNKNNDKQSLVHEFRNEENGKRGQNDDKMEKYGNRGVYWTRTPTSNNRKN